MARLDRLDAGKEVAQLGAVLGREFPYELLRSVSLQEEAGLKAGLAQLVDAELLYQRGTPSAATYNAASTSRSKLERRGYGRSEPFPATVAPHDAHTAASAAAHSARLSWSQARQRIPRVLEFGDLPRRA